MPSARPKVVLAMSGGVDSSVAAALLLRQGYDVLGAFMRLGSAHAPETESESCSSTTSATGNHKQGCCSVLDADDARRVAGVLGIPLYILNFQEDFGRVIDYFVAEYNRGRTPNPCVRCNDWLKFGKLAKYAEAVGAQYVASGHYARMGVDPATGERALLRGCDVKKDQSYVLFGMSSDAMKRTLLPIGDLEKSEVRRLAEELKLPVFNKPDSQEICFVPDGDYAGLVQRRSPDTFRTGPIVNRQGAEIGTHEGHQHFTVGQRRGVGVALGHPVYVVDIDSTTNRVMVGDRQDLLRTELIASQVNVLAERLRRPSQGVRCQAKVRYNSLPQPATAHFDGVDALHVRFDSPQPAITPGQAVVLYDDDIVLGGGWIDSAS